MPVQLSHETQSYAIALSQQKKSEADQRANISMANILRVAMLDMFSAGYNRALVDHGLAEADPEDETETDIEPEEENQS